MNNPLLTVVIAVYNNPDGLSKTVPSIIMQDYDNVEIIISDDGSSKYDKGVLEDYANSLRSRYSSVRINLLEENVGTVKHLNKALALANGKYYLCISPGDELVKEDVLSRVVKLFEKSGRLIITSKRVDAYADGRRKVRPRFYTGLLINMFPKQLQNFMLKKRNIISACGTFYSRKLFEKYGPFDEQYSLVEDYTYYVMLLGQKVKFGWINDVTVSHEMGGVSNGNVHPLVYKDIEQLKRNYGVMP